MALEFSNLPISLAQGLDTKSDPKQVVAGKLLLLENAIFQTIGQLSKRNGFNAIGGSTALSAGNALNTYGNELVMFDGSSVYSYTASDTKKINKGTKVAVDLSVTSILKNTYQQTAPDSAYHSTSGLTTYAWQDSQGGVRYSVLDTVTGAAIVSDTSVSTTGSKPKVKAIGNYIVISYAEGANLKYKSILYTTPTVLSSATTLQTNLGSTVYYDAQVISSKLFFTYADSSNQTSLFTLSTALAQSATTQVNIYSLCQCIFGDDSNNAWIAYYNNAGAVAYFIRDYSLASVLGATTIETPAYTTVANITGVYDTTVSKGRVIYELPLPVDTTIVSVANSLLRTSYNQYTRTATLTVGGTVTTPTDFLRSVGLASKLFMYGSAAAYVLVVHSSELQSGYYLVNSAGSIVARVATGSGGGLNTAYLLAEVNNPSTSAYSVPYLIKDLLTSINGDVYTQTGLSAANFTFGRKLATTSAGQILHVSGGAPSLYDGVQSVEQGFNLYPEFVKCGLRWNDGYGPSSTDLSNYYSAGGGLTSGTYQYKALYAWTDATGQIHRSAPSPEPLTTVVNASARKQYLTIDIASNTLRYTPNGGAGGVVPNIMAGYRVSGPGLTGNARVTDVAYSGGTIRISFATVGGVDGSTNLYTIMPTTEIVGLPHPYNMTWLEITNTDNRFNFSGSIVKSTSSVYTMQVADTSPFVVGMFLYQSSLYEYLGWYARITAVGTNSITVDTAINSQSQSYDYKCYNMIVGTITNTSNSMSGISAADLARCAVGDYLQTSFLATAGIPAGTTIVAIGASTITMSAAATATGTVYPSVTSLQSTVPMRIGHVITDGTTSATITALHPNLNALGFAYVETTATWPSSVSTTYTISNVQSNVVSVDTLRLTSKVTPNNVYVVLYRTVANGTVFYRVNSANTTLTLNDPTVDNVLIYDAVSDATLVGNEQLYTTGGEVENTPLPAASVMWTYKSRLLAVSSEDGLAINFSKTIQPSTPVEFNDAFVQRVEERDGNVTAGIQMDDKCIVFKYNSIYTFVGDGPTANGLDNNYTLPQLISSDNGCIEKRSVVLGPNGVYYQSAKGIYLLDRSLSVHYIGAGVEAYNSYTVTSAKVITNVNQVRFTMSNGVMLVHDYVVDQWSVFTGLNAIDSTIYQNLHTYIGSTGTTRQETVGTYTDDGSSVLMALKTSWLSLAGLQGFQRVRRLILLGKYFSAHTLTVSFAFDFSSSYAQTSANVVSSNPGVYQYRVPLSRQKCEALQIYIQETQSPTYGQGLSLSNLALEVGTKKGQARATAATTFS